MLNYTSNIYFLEKLISLGIDVNSKVPCPFRPYTIMSTELGKYVDSDKSIEKIKLLVKYRAIMDVKSICGLNYVDKPERVKRLNELIKLGLNVENRNVV